MIASFVSFIKANREWRALGLSGSLSPVSAELLPLYSSGRDPSTPDGNQVLGAQIWFALPVCRLYGSKAFIGLVAHEFAHAVRAAKVGENWIEEMGAAWTPSNGRRYEAEERRADGIASAWGFSREIVTMRNERKKVLDPYLAANEARILQRNFAK